MNTKPMFRLGLRWLGISIIALLGVLSIINSSSDGGDDGGVVDDGGGVDDGGVDDGGGDDGEPPPPSPEPEPLATMPDVEGQFANLQVHGDGMAFRLGVGVDPFVFTLLGYCKHYQGLARMDVDGTPYFFLVRSGNHTAGCLNSSDNPGRAANRRKP